MTPPNPVALPDKLYWIDQLRGAAAIVIVVFHYHHFYLSTSRDRSSIPPYQDFPYSDFIGPLYNEFASNAVELFWLISGVVFFHVYKTRKTGLRDFMVARFARLYPLHALTLFIVASLQLVSLRAADHWQIYSNNDLSHFMQQVFLSSNSLTFSRGLSFNGPIWSVSLEIPVYFMFLLSIFAMRRAPLVISAGMMLISVGLAVLKPIDLPVVRYSVFICATYFFGGCLLYRIVQITVPNKLACIVLCASLVFASALALALDHQPLGIFLLAGLVVVSVLLAEAFFPAQKKRSLLGDLSYSIYLVHVPLQIGFLLILDVAFDRIRSPADSYILLPAYIAATLAFAYWAHRYFEVPTGRFLRRNLASPTNRQIQQGGKT